MEKEGFIYIWYDIKRKMFYIGCHWGNINDGYICSSNRMRDAYRRRPQDFRRRILKRNIDRKKLLIEEHKWLNLIADEQLGKKYYNLSKKHFGHWSQNPSKLKDMIINNMGKNNPMYGKPSPFKGKKHSEETKQKIRERRKNQIYTESTCKKISDSHLGHRNSFYGKKHTEQTINRISDKWNIIFPDGSIKLITSLSRFCKEHGLSNGNMIMVSQGKRKNHKGFKVYKAVE